MIAPHARSCCLAVPQAASRFARFRFIVLGLLASLLALGSACDKVPLTAPSGSEITLFSNTTTVPLNGSADIIATVIENGGTLAHNGTLVTFTTTIGTLDPTEARTHNGQVTVRLRTASRSGVAVVRAFSGGTQSGDLEINVGAAAAADLLLAATPATVSTRGGTVELLAVLVDDVGNGLPGVPVTFSASRGQLGATRVVTNEEGEARTTLTTDQETTVRASAGAVQSDEVTIRARPAPRVNITSGGGTFTVGQPITFTITVTVDAGGAPVRDVTVDYGDGRSDSLGSLTGSTTVQHTFRTPNSYRVTATAVDAAGERGDGTTIVVVQAAQQPTLTMTLPATVARTVPFTVTVTPANVQTGVTLVSTRFDFGDGQPPVTVNGTQTSYSYGSVTTFSVTAVATFSNGQTATAVGNIRVTP